MTIDAGEELPDVFRNQCALAGMLFSVRFLTTWGYGVLDAARQITAAAPAAAASIMAWSLGSSMIGGNG